MNKTWGYLLKEIIFKSEFLNSREKYILGERLKGRLLKDIGQEYGVSRERIGQIEAKAIRKLHAWQSRLLLEGKIARGFSRWIEKHINQLWDIWPEIDREQLRNRIIAECLHPDSHAQVDEDIYELDLPTKILNALKRAGIETISQLKTTPLNKIKRIRNIGPKSLELIKKQINS